MTESIPPQPETDLPDLNRAHLADAILSTALDCIIVSDDSGRILEFNAAAERTFGMARHQVLGRKMDDTIVPHHHRAAHRHGMSRYLAGGEAHVLGRRVEVEALRADGTIFPVELSITETCTPGGRLFVATLRDISQQKADAAALQEARATMQGFFDHAPVGIHINRIGPQGITDQRVEFANDAMARPFGMDGAQMIGLDLYTSFAGTEIMEMVRGFDEVIAATAEPQYYETVNPLTGRFERYTRFPIMDAAGKLTHIGGMNVDIDDRVRAKQELDEARSLMETVFDNIPAELFLSELDGTFIMMNKWGAAFYGSDPEGMKGRQASEYDVGEEVEIARLAQERLLATGKPVVQEYNYTIGGRNVVVSNTIFPVRDAEGNITRVGGFTTDVTELHNARKAMQAAQATLQSFVDQVPVGLHVNRLGPEGIASQIVEYSNENMGRPYRLPARSLIGRNPYEVITDPQVVQAEQAVDARILATGQPVHIERLNPYNGRHESYTRFPILDASGAITHIGGMQIDIDERVRAKQQLDEVKALLESIFDNVPAVLYLRELDGRFVMINKYGAAVLGRRGPADLVGARASDFDSDVEKAEAREVQDMVLATGMPATQEYRQVTPEGEVIVLNTIFPIRDANGQIARIGGFATDVSELYKARNELLATQNLLQTIFDNVPAELYLRRLDGRYLMANHWALDFYGMTEADLPNLTAETFDTGEGTEVSRQAQRELLATGRPVTREYRHMARGRDVVILNTIFPLRNAEGEIDRIGGVSTDITELHKARNQLRQAEESLHQSEKLAALGQLLAGIAHELNNPLAVVLGRAAILQEKLADTPHAAPLQKLRDAANRCARIIKTFLAMARQTGPRRQAVEVNDLIESALEMTTYGLRSEDVSWNSALLAARLEIEVDPDQIVQVLINLILNAQHALRDKDSGRRIDIRAELGPDPLWLHITVADNGPGVPDAIANRIFDPFFTTKDVGQGTGLGLSVCKGMVEAHGGKLLLSKTPGGGASFTLVLPVRTPLGADAEDKAGESDTAKVRGRILVVDDEVEIAAILADCLAPLGIECVIATDGRMALQRLAEAPFDGIFCDVSMPGMDGITFYGHLKGINPELARHLVFISGDVLHRDWERVKAAVDRPIIEKPFDPQQVRDAALLLLASDGSRQ